MTVTFAWKDGAAPAGVELPAAVKVDKGIKLVLPSEPSLGTTVDGERDGKKGTWTFNGWDAQADTVVNANLTVNGIWGFAAAGGEQGGQDAEAESARKALADEIARIKAEQAKYTGESWAAFSTALAAAEQAAGKQGATAEELKAALAGLAAAEKSTLKVKGDGGNNGGGQGNQPGGNGNGDNGNGSGNGGQQPGGSNGNGDNQGNGGQGGNQGNGGNNGSNGQGNQGNQGGNGGNGGSNGNGSGSKGSGSNGKGKGGSLPQTGDPLSMLGLAGTGLAGLGALLAGAKARAGAAKKADPEAYDPAADDSDIDE